MAGGRTLHRQMARGVRILVGGVVQQPHIGQDNGIHTQVRGAVDCALPLLPAVWLWVGVDGAKYPAALGVGVFNTLPCTLFVKVQARKLAGVSAVAKAEIHRIGAVIDGGFQCGKATGGANKFHGILHCKGGATITPLPQGMP